MKKKLSFKMIYIVYVSVLVLLVALATLYVSRLLKKYEDTMPEQYVKNAYEELVAEMTACFMSVNLLMEATQDHLDNHKAYVQAWIQAIRDKPDTLVKAIKDAQTAASYMDWKGGFITEKEYLNYRESTMTIQVKSARNVDRER